MNTVTEAPGTRASSKKRDIYWDAARGIAIIAVIWIHAATGDRYEGTDYSWNFSYWIVQRQFLNFAVALFFFVGGYFAYSSKARFGPWMTKRARRLLVPFIFWSVFYGAVLLILNPDSVTNLVRFAAKIVLGMTAAHLYFIVVLVQLTLLTPWLVRAVNMRFGWGLFLITPAYIAGLYFVTWRLGDLPDGYQYMFFGWFAFYYAGLMVRARGLPRVRASVAAAGVIVALGLSLLEAFVLTSKGWPLAMAITQLNATSVLFSFAVIIQVIALKRPVKSGFGRALGSLGLISYGVYYVHMVWMMAMNRMATRLPLDVPLPLIQVVEIMVALALSLAVIALGRVVLGRRRATNLLGF